MAKVSKKSIGRTELTKRVSQSERLTKRPQMPQFCVLFWKHKGTSYDRTGRITIMMRVTYKRRYDVTTQIHCHEDQFDARTITVHGDAPATLRLRHLANEAHRVHADMRLTGRPIIPKVVIGAVFNLPDLLVPSFRQLLERFEAYQADRLKAGEIIESTYKTVVAWHGLLLDYYAQKHGSDVLLDDVVPHDADGLQTYLKAVKGLSHNYIQHIVQHLKRLLTYAVANDWLDRSPFLAFRRKFKHERKDALTLEELRRIEDADLVAGFDIVRDVFVFMCYTGLAYADCQQLAPKHLSELGGELCLIKPRQKTREVATVPLTSEALAILDKYRHSKFCLKRGTLLPVFANARINTDIKQIGRLAGVGKIITCHMARRTCATLLLNNGASLKAVAVALGHSNTATTERHYATMNNETVVKELKAAFGNLQPRKAQ